MVELGKRRGGLSYLLQEIRRVVTDTLFLSTEDDHRGMIKHALFYVHTQ